MYNGYLISDKAFDLLEQAQEAYLRMESFVMTRIPEEGPTDPYCKETYENLKREYIKILDAYYEQLIKDEEK